MYKEIIMPSLQDIKNYWNSKSAFDIGKDYQGGTRVGFVGDQATLGQSRFNSPEELYSAVYGGGGGGGGTRQPSVTKEDIDATMNRIGELGKEGRDWISGQIEDVYGDFTNLVQGFKPIGEVAQNIGEELLLPELTQSAKDLATSLKNIPEVAQQTLAGKNINANQLARIIQNRQQKFAPNVEDAVTNMQFAQEELGRRLQYELADREQLVQPILTKAQMYNASVASYMSSYTQQMKSQLDVLIQKLANEGSLAVAELQALNDLAIAELDYNATMAELNNNTQIETIGGRKKLINMMTGETVADLGPSSVGGGLDSGGLNEIWDSTGSAQIINPSNTSNSGSSYFDQNYTWDFTWE